MVLVSVKPFTLEQIAQLQEQFDEYIKTVIDIDRKICAAGMDRHFEGEQLLLKKGSSQHALWGGGIDIHTLEIDCNSFINIRPNDNNSKNELLDPELRKQYINLTKYFFKIVL